MDDALTAVWVFAFLAFVTGDIVFLFGSFCAYMDYREQMVRPDGP